MRPGRLLLFEAARTFCHSLTRVNAARDFLNFKLAVLTHAREKILGAVNKGVTTLKVIADPVTGFPTEETKESHDAFAVMELRMWFDLLVFEMVSIGDALAQAANVIFEFNESPKKMLLTQLIHERIRNELRAKFTFAQSESEATGLDEWVEAASWLQDVRELRNQATHRHLVKLLESKPWSEKPTTPPVRGYLRSEYYVDLGDGREEPIGDWVALTVDRVHELLNRSAKRLADVLTLLRSTLPCQ